MKASSKHWKYCFWESTGCNGILLLAFCFYVIRIYRFHVKAQNILLQRIVQISNGLCLRRYRDNVIKWVTGTPGCTQVRLYFSDLKFWTWQYAESGFWIWDCIYYFLKWWNCECLALVCSDFMPIWKLLSQKEWRWSLHWWQGAWCLTA